VRVDEVARSRDGLLVHRIRRHSDILPGRRPRRWWRAG
jgi:hypothetical protein